MLLIRKRKLKKVLRSAIVDAQVQMQRSLNKENKAWWLGQRDAYQKIFEWME